MEVLEIIKNAYTGYANYLWSEISNPSWHNYFYALTLVSLFFFLLEVAMPWRKKQAVFRKDFFLDVFYMYFNFFLFSLIIYNAGSEVFVHGTRKIFAALFSIDLSSFNPLDNKPIWLVFLIGFIIRDFIQWLTHRLLHRIPFLWEFHKVHHSVKEMGFAAHLRYHWMETIVYRTVEYLPLAFLGIGLYDFYFIHIFSILVGHYNHSNISIPYSITGAIVGALAGLIIGSAGFDTNIISDPNLISLIIAGLVGSTFGFLILSKFIKYIFNNPEMHIWHHAKQLPEKHKYGVNFGLSLAIWDYLFSTAYIPHNGRDIELGFSGDKRFPKTFFRQITHGLKR